MINFVEGNFLHIDFGHFLENKKSKFGYKRERDPFVFTPEIAYFVNGKSITKKSKAKINEQITPEEHEIISASILSNQDLDPVKSNKLQPNVVVDEYKTANYFYFEELCCKAYNILRANANQLINLFLIMLSAGMPELKHKEEIEALVKKLDLNLSEREAAKKFQQEITTAINTFSRRVDNLFHNYKQVEIKKNMQKFFAEKFGSNNNKK